MRMKSILIVEDDVHQQELLKTILEASYRVLLATNANDAWVLMQKERPDLMLLDIILPGGMNGFDLLEKVKKDPLLATVPVIILTNVDTEEKTAHEIGASDYLIKANMSVDNIAAKVKAVLG